MAPGGKRGLWASTPWLGVAVGIMAATGLGVLLTTVFSDEKMASFDWRVRFVAGAILWLYGLFIRFRMAESRVFERCVEAAADDVVVVARPSVWRTLWSEKRAVLHISALPMSGVVVFYTWFIFAPSYAVAMHGMDAQHSLGCWRRACSWTWADWPTCRAGSRWSTSSPWASLSWRSRWSGCWAPGR